MLTFHFECFSRPASTYSASSCVPHQYKSQQYACYGKAYDAQDPGRVHLRSLCKKSNRQQKDNDHKRRSQTVKQGPVPSSSRSLRARGDRAQKTDPGTDVTKDFRAGAGSAQKKGCGGQEHESSREPKQQASEYSSQTASAFPIFAQKNTPTDKITTSYSLWG